MPKEIKATASTSGAAFGSGLKPALYKCNNCGYHGKPKIKSRGSCVLFFVLLILFVLPGILYALWMATGRKYSCPKCGNRFIFKD